MRIEIYNYLNIIDRRLGKLYKYSGFSPLPEDFEVTEEKFKERIFMSELKNEEVLPPFIYENKKDIKKCFKNMLKNIKKIEKSGNYKHLCTPKFAEELDLYFTMSIAVCEMILKDFKTYDFNEVLAYQELYNINPILAPYLTVLFSDRVDIQTLFDGLEAHYTHSYLSKIKILEKRTQKKQAKEREIQSNVKNLQNTKKILQKSRNIGKKVEKIEQSAKKMKNKHDVEEVKEKLRQAKYNTNNSTTVTTEKIKETQHNKQNHNNQSQLTQQTQSKKQAQTDEQNYSHKQTKQSHTSTARQTQTNTVKQTQTNTVKQAQTSTVEESTNKQREDC